jgi:hypothetical protein
MDRLRIDILLRRALVTFINSFGRVEVVIILLQHGRCDCGLICGIKYQVAQTLNLNPIRSFPGILLGLLVSRPCLQLHKF